MVGLIVFVILIGLMLINVPIAIGTALATLGGIIAVGDLPVMVLVQRMFVGIDTFTLIAVPLFILTGRMMALGGITTDLINLSRVLVGFMRGGLAYINIVSSMFFAGITGSAASDTSSVGAILIPAMVEKGYEKDFSVAVTATSSTIGVMIPPSIPMVIYGVASGSSIGRLFLGGFVPGVMVGLFLMAVTFVLARKRNYPVEVRVPLSTAIITVIKGIPALMTILIIIVGIVSGVFTPTEAAGIAAFYSFLLGTLYYKELKLKHIPDIIVEVATTTGMVALMIATASALGWLFANQGIPQMIGNALLSITTNPVIIMLLVNLLLLFVGTWLDLSPAVIIFTPILLPIVQQIGIDPVHFGVIMVVNLAIGLFTPPVGVCLFVSCGIAGISIAKTVRAFIPFFVSMVLVLILITYIPQLVMFLPNLLMP
ncbi:C4-dicarboxylate ABC transporter permease [Marispirochaeta aestuarii]|uniref:C4-dicarboxylate ABC transporter permease n=1 Tax=Marispirochaeta aestuarii TaxID=1963862 RepID=A0A1Y1S1W5_9SPIO|nr:TRAP transporter large permease [Marispirochaeta aestuarii]ORC37776.1 C4-dicarboxylate ABC transporter permease [Marispirochaeta aestuarii]